MRTAGNLPLSKVVSVRLRCCRAAQHVGFGHKLEDFYRLVVANNPAAAVDDETVENRVERMDTIEVIR